MNIAILGYGSQGRAAYEYWNKAGNQLTICDSRYELRVPEGTGRQLGETYLHNLGRFDLIVRAAPSIHPREILEANPDSPTILSKVTTVTNEFFKVCPSKHIIGVTGTKGKGTTSSLVAAILQAAGKTVHLGGNIGVPPLDMLQAGIQPDDWVVLELANFQLIDIHYSPPIGVCVMVVPEHLNWHKDMDEYVQAKQQLFKYQTKDDLAVYNRESHYSKEIAAISPGRKISYEVPGPGAEPQQTTGAYLKNDTIYMDGAAVCKTSDIALLGRHNIENVCAAVAATWEVIGKRAEVVQQAVRQFKGLEHRLEFVRDFDGVHYYDDSFGTTPETAMVAIQAFEQPKVVILGGSDKGAGFDELAHVVATHEVRAAVVIGDTGPAIRKALEAAGYHHIIDGGQSMTQIVDAARAQAHPGDVVLLSTGCASFGLFKDYKDRGQQFQQAVNHLH